MGGPKGSSKHMTVGKEGKENRFNQREKKIPNAKFVRFGYGITPPGNMVELESLKPWLGKVMEDVR